MVWLSLTRSIPSARSSIFFINFFTIAWLFFAVSIENSIRGSALTVSMVESLIPLQVILILYVPGNAFPPPPLSGDPVRGADEPGQRYPFLSKLQ
ncbi:hypothetical protein ES708_28285 [subsurface metagenome]